MLLRKKVTHATDVELLTVILVTAHRQARQREAVCGRFIEHPTGHRLDAVVAGELRDPGIAEVAQRANLRRPQRTVAQQPRK